MGKRGPKPLEADEKARRGTLRPSRERRRGAGNVPSGSQAATAGPDYTGNAAEYAADVISGRIPASKWVRLACERQQRDRRRSDSDPTWPYVWSAAHAEEACAFVERLPHVEGRWETPTITLHAAQVFILCCLFGWRLRADQNRRRFTQLYFEMGRKGAKSTLAAAIALFHLLREQEPGASVVCGASTGQQARVTFGIMQRMVRRSAYLRELGAQAYANAIVAGDGNARPVNSKASTLDGLNPSCIVLDEAHAQDFGLHDVLKSAQGARLNPLLVCPTTAGFDLLSVGYALRQTLGKILEGVFEADHFLGVIYTIDEGDDWREERNWIKANPMAGITPTWDWLRRYCLDATQTPGLEGEFRVKVCSEWLHSSSAWLPMASWDACADTNLRLDQFEGEECWIGGDLAQLDDITAIAALFRRGDLVVALVKMFLPRDVVEERARAVPAYRSWVNSGVLVPTEGGMVDFNIVEAEIRAWCKRFRVRAIRLDQFASAQLVSRLTEDGLPAAILDKNARTFTAPSRELEARVRHRRFRHDGNSALKWMVSNCYIRRGVDDSLLPKKSAPDSPDKIDAVDAILQAMSALIVDLPSRPRRRVVPKLFTRDGWVAVAP